MAQQTFSGVPGTFSAGEILTASDQEKLRDFILYLIKDGDETDTGEVSPLILDLGSDIVNVGNGAKLGVNETNPGALLQVSGNGAGAEVLARFADTDTTVTAGNVISQFWFTGDGVATGGFYIEFRDSTAVIGSVTCAGAAAVAFNTTSDYRLKSNVADMVDAVDTVAALRPITFNFERDPDELVHHGFLAHEAAEVCPRAVTGDKDAMNPAVDAVLDDDGNELEPAQPESIRPQMMDAAKLVPLLTAAVQELSARVAALEAAA